jgi:hypothetical protein
MAEKESDPYTELAARLGVDRTKVKRLLLGAAYGDRVSLETLKRVSGGDHVQAKPLALGAAYSAADMLDSAWLADADLSAIEAQIARSAFKLTAHNATFDLGAIKTASGDDAITAKRMPNSEDLTVSAEKLYLAIDTESPSGKGEFRQLLERLVQDARSTSGDGDDQ